MDAFSLGGRCSMNRLIAEICAYRAANAGEFPREIVLSEFEMADLKMDPALRFCSFVFESDITTVYGVAIRVGA